MAQYGSINIRFTATKDSFDKALGQIGSAVNRFGNEAKRVFQKATEDSARFNAEAAKTPGLLDKTTKELKEFRRAAEGIYFAGLHLTYIGAALSGMAFLPIKAAADFERAMSKVLAVTTGAENRFTELQKVASELGRTTKFTATEVANGLSFLGLAGFTAAESISAIEPALHLAAAGAIDLATSADIASNVLQAMRLPVHELQQVTDVLANTATSANTNILQLAEALKYAAPPAAAAGIEIEQLAALLGTLGNAGIQASLAGTSLRAILASLAKPSKEAQETMQRLGVAVTMTGRGAIDLVKTLEDLGRAQLTLADANAIFQRRGAAAALTLAQQIDKVHELTAANELAQGAAERMAVTMEDNVTGAFIRVTSAADGLARAFADPLLPVLKGDTALGGQHNNRDGGNGRTIPHPIGRDYGTCGCYWNSGNCFGPDCSRVWYHQEGGCSAHGNGIVKMARQLTGSFGSCQLQYFPNGVTIPIHRGQGRTPYEGDRLPYENN